MKTKPLVPAPPVQEGYEGLYGHRDISFDFCKEPERTEMATARKGLISLVDDLPDNFEQMEEWHTRLLQVGDPIGGYAYKSIKLEIERFREEEIQGENGNFGIYVIFRWDRLGPSVAAPMDWDAHSRITAQVFDTNPSARVFLEKICRFETMARFALALEEANRAQFLISYYCHLVSHWVPEPSDM